MATTFSFDIVSNYDLAEMNNAIDQAQRELGNRYDFKGTNAHLAFRDSSKTGLTLTGDTQYHIDAILEIIRKKLALRGLSQKILDTSKEPITSNMKVTQDVTFKKGLSQDSAKKISAVIREQYPKIKVQIQGSELRVTSTKKDELQNVMRLLEDQDFDFPLHFTNYR